MNRRYNKLGSVICLILLGAACFLQTGCAMCCGTYDYAYGGHGGIWQRSDLEHGRVGSPFSDPNVGFGNEEVILPEDSDLELIQ